MAMPLHQRSMTLAEWDALPEDNSAQYELAAGVFVVSRKRCADISWRWLSTITVFGLGAPGDGDVESQTAAHELVVEVPFPLRIDVDALVGRSAH